MCEHILLNSLFTNRECFFFLLRRTQLRKEMQRQERENRCIYEGQLNRAGICEVAEERYNTGL